MATKKSHKKPASKKKGKKVAAAEPARKKPKTPKPPIKKAPAKKQAKKQAKAKASARPKKTKREIALVRSRAAKKPKTPKPPIKKTPAKKQAKKQAKAKTSARPKKTKREIALVRSRAAKKGWMRRRINALYRTPYPSNLKIPATLKETGELSPEVISQFISKGLHEKEGGPSYQFAFSFVRADFSQAVAYSSLRHMPFTGDLLKRLRAAAERGDAYLEETADEIADEYGVDPREVYTLFKSH